MDGCDQDVDDECPAHYGEAAHGKLYFTTDVAASKLPCKIYGKVAGIWLPFPGGCPVPDGCAALEKGDCPLVPGEEIIYDITLTIENYFPPVSTIYSVRKLEIN